MGFVAERGKPKRIWPGAASNIGHDCWRSWQESLHNSLRSLELKLASGRSQPFVFGVFRVILLDGTFRMFGHCGATQAFGDCSGKPGYKRQSRRTLGCHGGQSPSLAGITEHVWSRGVTRWCRCSLSVADPLVCRCLASWTMLPSSHPAHRTGRACFRHPALGERFTMRPREIARPFSKAHEAQHFVQGCLRKPFGRRPHHVVLGTQPLTQPFASVLICRPIGLADWA